MKKNLIFVVIGIILGRILGIILLWFFGLKFGDKIELANFIVTTLAFGAAIYAIYYQHKESEKAEKKFNEQLSLQKQAALNAEIIGAWQVLANKASGNSGKKEAIEFLASQALSLRGIDMSSATHDGPVYLDFLFKNFKEDRRKIFLMDAKFSKVSLLLADFSGAYLFGANFSGAYLEGANFSGANLGKANFLGAQLSDDKDFDKGFIDCYCEWSNDVDCLPTPPPGYKFEFEERTDENNQPIYPKNDPDYRYIKLIKLK
jgi:hypothetical protein